MVGWEMEMLRLLLLLGRHGQRRQRRLHYLGLHVRLQLRLGTQGRCREVRRGRLDLD